MLIYVNIKLTQSEGLAAQQVNKMHSNTHTYTHTNTHTHTHSKKYTHTHQRKKKK